ncbi:MAG: replication/maintenance protein RepL [Bacteroidaceae bacterium]|nr:replication/maintenance protein RepL [Bacteroidaceae bacterium]
MTSVGSIGSSTDASPVANGCPRKLWIFNQRGEIDIGCQHSIQAVFTGINHPLEPSQLFGICNFIIAFCIGLHVSLVEETTVSTETVHDNMVILHKACILVRINNTFVCIAVAMLMTVHINLPVCSIIYRHYVGTQGLIPSNLSLVGVHVVTNLSACQLLSSNRYCCWHTVLATSCKGTAFQPNTVLVSGRVVISQSADDSTTVCRFSFTYIRYLACV